jgi:hypothetical protein
MAESSWCNLSVLKAALVNVTGSELCSREATTC